MIGPENVAGPTLSGLATNFGLQPLIGKPLAIISDARLSGKSDAAVVVERLLSITGEDALTIDRKHLPAWTGTLPTKFALISNELPRLSDSSGALAGRLILLQLTRSFYGREDHGLTDLLMTELPGILLWAIEGWRRLRERGHFLQPDSGRQMIEEMEDLASPIGAFLKERCVVAGRPRDRDRRAVRRVERLVPGEGPGPPRRRARFRPEPPGRHAQPDHRPEADRRGTEAGLHGDRPPNDGLLTFVCHAMSRVTGALRN